MPVNAPATDSDARELAPSDDVGITVGVIGQPWRVSVSAWGSATPWGESVDRPLDWAIAADDRWHLPAQEAAVRQRRIAGTPVVETRVRIPDGDAVQRIWSVADRGGLTVVEIENDSPLPFAVAFFGRAVLTERKPTDVPIQGIELPDGAITLPVAHHTTIRVAIPHGPLPDGLEPHGVSLTGLAPSDAVVRGWEKLAGNASRLNLPDERLTESMIEARCDLLLEGPVDPDIDPTGFVLDVGELVRCGDDADVWLVDIVGPLESVARSNDPQLLAALAAGERIARVAGDDRAGGDIDRLRRKVGSRVVPAPLGPLNEIRRGRSVGRFVADLERRLVDGGDLLPMGLPASWLGANFELHGVPTGPRSTVSLAVRWHGDRPAILWEQQGPPQTLTASAVDETWVTTEAAGEGLWAAPRSARHTTLPLAVVTSEAASETGPPTAPETAPQVRAGDAARLADVADVADVAEVADGADVARPADDDRLGDDSTSFS